MVFFFVRLASPALHEFLTGRVEVSPSPIHYDGLFAVKCLDRGAFVTQIGRREDQ